jgi:hypothetical protein
MKYEIIISEIAESVLSDQIILRRIWVGVIVFALCFSPFLTNVIIGKKMVAF